jgi:hypothetical protein
MSSTLRRHRRIQDANWAIRETESYVDVSCCSTMLGTALMGAFQHIFPGRELIKYIYIYRI